MNSVRLKNENVDLTAQLAKLECELRAANSLMDEAQRVLAERAELERKLAEQQELIAAQLDIIWGLPQRIADASFGKRTTEWIIVGRFWKDISDEEGVTPKSMTQVELDRRAAAPSPEVPA